MPQLKRQLFTWDPRLLISVRASQTSKEYANFTPDSLPRCDNLLVSVDCGGKTTVLDSAHLKRALIVPENGCTLSTGAGPVTGEAFEIEIGLEDDLSQQKTWFPVPICGIDLRSQEQKGFLGLDLLKNLIFHYNYPHGYFTLSW